MNPEYKKELKKIQKIIRKNTDHTKMEIGDRVIPWDGSSLTDIDGNKYYVIDEPFISTKYWIVVDNNLNILYNDYIQDLIICNPITNQMFRISSAGVKH
jgi:hypothetical protein